MGGVDRLDKNIAQYRIGIRSRKWYWPIIAYLLQTAMHNAWILYRDSDAAASFNTVTFTFTVHSWSV